MLSNIIPIQNDLILKKENMDFAISSRLIYVEYKQLNPWIVCFIIMWWQLILAYEMKLIHLLMTFFLSKVIRCDDCDADLNHPFCDNDCLTYPQIINDSQGKEEKFIGKNIFRLMHQ